MIFRSLKSKKEFIRLVENKTKRYNLINLLVEGHAILTYNENNYIHIIIPWSIGVREFKGKLYEERRGVCFEGEFIIPKRVLVLRITIWSFVVMALMVLVVGFKGIIMMNLELLGIVLFCIIIIVWDLWYVLKFHNRKCETQIIDFINTLL